MEFAEYDIRFYNDRHRNHAHFIDWLLIMHSIKQKYNCDFKVNFSIDAKVWAF